MCLTTECQTKWGKIELQEETDESIIIVGYVNVSLSEMHRFSRQKITEDGI